MRGVRKYIIFLGVMLFFGCADNEVFNESFFKNKGEKASKEFETSNDRMPYASRYFLEASPLVEFIIDYKDQKSIRYNKELKKTCDYTKIPFRTSNITHWNSENFVIGNSVKILCVNETNKLNDKAIDKLFEFVAKGGTLFFPTLSADERLSYLYGLNPSANMYVNSTAYGFKFNIPILPNHSEKTYKKELIHFGLAAANFSSKINVLATAINDSNYPTIIENTIGDGKVIFFNSVTEFRKVDRGLLFACALKGLEGVPYPIANVSTFFLDDFPSTLYHVKKEPIASEMDLTIAEFVDEIWWPDMLKLAYEYDIKYTTTITFNYNNRIAPPFLFTEWDHNKREGTDEGLSNAITHHVLKKKHELGFHGYNHISLLKNEWTNPNHIATSLKTVKKKWKVSGYGAFPVSYIPPSNMIDSTGLSQLKLGMPSLKYMCSSYLGQTHNGGNREFDIDPFHSGFFDFPRATFGFHFTDMDLFNKESLYLFTGIWSHFVHPDDVYQIKDKDNVSVKGDYEYRNPLGLGWHKSKNGQEGMYFKFRKYVQEHKKMYPHSKFFKAEDGGAMVHYWRASSYDHINSSQEYKVEKIKPKGTGKQYWFTYVSKEHINEIENYLKSKALKYHNIAFLNGFLINIETLNPSISLPMLKRQSASINQLAYNELLLDYQEFNDLKRRKHNKEVTEEEILISEELNLEEKIAVLREEMFAQKDIDTTSWNMYATYKSWQKNYGDVWDDLEEFYNNEPTYKTALYSNQLAEIVWYPNEGDQEKWLKRQLAMNTDDIQLLKRYVREYNTPENKYQITKTLKKIASLEPTKENRGNYIRHLLWNDSDAAMEEFEGLKRTAAYSDVAKDIAWFYYDKGYLDKAYQWGELTDELPIAVKLDWLYKLKDYEKLEQTYNKHINDSPNDDKAKTAMAYIYHSLGEFQKSWLVANSIAEGYPGKIKLKEMLNKDVKYTTLDIQKALIVDDHNALFDAKIRDSIAEHIRLKTANFVSFDGDISSDKANNSLFEKTASYNLVTKKRFIHSIATTNSNVYALNTTLIDPDNVDRDLYGIQYRIKNPISYDKPQYWARARIEKDVDDKFFYQFEAGASISRSKWFASTTFNLHPVRNGAAYSKGIYRNRLGVYYEKRFESPFYITSYIEGNYYSENALSGSLTGKTFYNVLKTTNYKIAPFLEGQYALGSEDLPNGYPYWMLKSRAFGGLGLSGTLGLKENAKAKISLDAAHFLDDYSDSFSRFTGQTSIRFLKYFVFQGSFEYFVLSEYYSNRFNFGLKYYLK